MNKDYLKIIFDNYINKFEYITVQMGENYKWTITDSFHDLINPEGDNFAQRIKEASRLSSNLVDSAQQYGFSSLVKCAQIDEQTTRDIFFDLFKNDGNDLDLRQQKINRFILNSNKLINKYVSEGNQFLNNQRTAMALLFLYDPDNNYLYKATEAYAFASYIEYYDDWGPYSNFDLKKFYTMCDFIVEEIRNNKALIETTRSRFFDKDNKEISDINKDKNYHILVSDLIFGASEERYNLCCGIPYKKITSQARKLHDEQVRKANEFLQTKTNAEKLLALREEAENYLRESIKKNIKVRHKLWGDGTVKSSDGNNCEIEFSNGNVKKFILMTSFNSGCFSVDIPDFDQKIKEYDKILKTTRFRLEDDLKRARQDFEAYAEFIE